MALQDTGSRSTVEHCQASDRPYHSTLCQDIEEKVFLQGKLVDALKICCLSGN